MNRIPLTIWITLYLMAILSMVIMGYQAGLTDRRSPVATITMENDLRLEYYPGE